MEGRELGQNCQLQEIKPLQSKSSKLTVSIKPNQSAVSYCFIHYKKATLEVKATETKFEMQKEKEILEGGQCQDKKAKK